MHGSNRAGCAECGKVKNVRSSPTERVRRGGRFELGVFGGCQSDMVWVERVVSITMRKTKINKW